jgi:hypothetical protein
MHVQHLGLPEEPLSDMMSRGRLNSYLDCITFTGAVSDSVIKDNLMKYDEGDKILEE